MSAFDAQKTPGEPGRAHESIEIVEEERKHVSESPFSQHAEYLERYTVLRGPTYSL